MDIIVKNILRKVLPTPIKRVVRRAFPARESLLSYQGVTTQHNMKGLHSGRFASTFDKYRTLDPNQVNPNTLRMRIYFACMFAYCAKQLDGEFMSLGVSYGVAPKIIYEFVGGKHIHLVDPFLGIDPTGDSWKYNTNPERVRREFPEGAVTFHFARIPECLPMPLSVSFAHVNTSSPIDEAKSLPMLYNMLVPGGVMLVDEYAIYPGFQHIYDDNLPCEIFTLPTGQGVIFKSA